MFESENIIYIQLEKTGCTHIASLLSELFGGTQIKKHNPLDNFDTDKLIIGSIRNPWDWYVSLWAFSTKGDETIYKNVTKRSIKNALKRFSGSDDQANFTKWLKNAPLKRGIATGSNSFRGIWAESQKPVSLWRQSYEDPYDPAKFKLWLKLIMDSRRADDLGNGYGQHAIGKFAGLMTYRYCRLYLKNFLRESRINTINSLDSLYHLDKTANVLDGMIKTENLESDLLEVLKKSGLSLSEEQVKQVLDRPKINTSQRFDTGVYYDSETVALVASKERFIVDKYNYQPPNLH